MSETPEVLDCLGEACPMPLVHMNELIESRDPGVLVDVLSDDEGSKVDIPVWCRMRGHEFLGRDDRPEGGWIFHVKAKA
jgi:tRNA 2-thiouridine synthesizing protein A